MVKNKEKLNKAIQKELDLIAKAEAKLQRKAETDTSKYKELLASKIPKGLNQTLEKSFYKAFETVFKSGVSIIEKSYDKESISQDFEIQNYSIDLKCRRKELKQLKRKVKHSDFKNLSITTIEGVGLGTLGIGLPDIVIFIGMILKGIYEISLRYGYDYDPIQEKRLILTMIKTALSKGDEWKQSNIEADKLFDLSGMISEEGFKEKIEDTSKTLAMDMIVFKFIQGLPIVGVVGGVFNPVYYNKIMNYVRLKYHKRYLLDKLNAI